MLERRKIFILNTTEKKKKTTRHGQKECRMSESAENRQTLQAMKWQISNKRRQMHNFVYSTRCPLTQRPIFWSIWTVKSYAMLYRIVWYGKMIDYLAKLNENFNWCWTIYIFLQADRKYWMKLVEKSMDGVQKVRVRIERDESFGNFSWIFFCRSLHGRLSSSRLFHLLEYFSMHIFWKDSTIPSISANCTVTTALHKHDYKATSKWTCIWDSSCLLQ